MRKVILAMTMAVAMGAVAQTEMATPKPVQVIRLDKALQQYATLDSAQRTQLVDSLQPEINAFFELVDGAAPSDSMIQAWSESRAVEVFQPEVDKAFPNLNEIEQQLAYIVQNARRDSLDFGPMQFCAVTWGYNQYVTKYDTIVFVALNHYLGDDYPGYAHIPAYTRRQKTPEMLQYNVAEALVRMQFPFQPAEPPTLLSTMMYEGSVTAMVMDLVHDAQLYMALGYTPEQLQEAEDKAEQIWEELEQSDLLNTTDPAIINRLFAPIPLSPLLDGTAPGAIASYLGYELARSPKPKAQGLFH